MDRPRVTRRKAIAGGAGIALAGVGGWWAFGRDEPGPLDDLPDGIRTAEFAWSREASEYTDQQQRQESGYFRPQVRVTDESVRVNGILRYGSSECNFIHVESLSYSDSTVRAAVGFGQEDGGWFGVQSCTDDSDQGSYLLEVAFESRPAALVATAHHRQGETETTTHEFEDGTLPN